MSGGRWGGGEVGVFQQYTAVVWGGSGGCSFNSRQLLSGV